MSTADREEDDSVKSRRACSPLVRMSIAFLATSTLGVVLYVGYRIVDDLTGWRDLRVQAGLQSDDTAVIILPEGLHIIIAQANDRRVQHAADLAGARTYGLCLNGARLTDNGFKEIARFRMLKSLGLFETGQSSSGLMELAGIETIELVGIQGTQFSDAGLRGIGQLAKLRELVLTDTSITDEGLSHLRNLPSLSKLYIRRTFVTGAGFRYLGGIRKLTDLSLLECAATDDGIGGVATCSQLQTLDLTDARISGDGVRKLASLVNLQRLSILQTTATKKDIRLLISRLPKLEDISVPIDLATQLQDEGVLPLATDRIEKGGCESKPGSN